MDRTLRFAALAIVCSLTLAGCDQPDAQPNTVARLTFEDALLAAQAADDAIILCPTPNLPPPSMESWARRDTRLRGWSVYIVDDERFPRARTEPGWPKHVAIAYRSGELADWAGPLDSIDEILEWVDLVNQGPITPEQARADFDKSDHGSTAQHVLGARLDRAGDLLGAAKAYVASLDSYLRQHVTTITRLRELSLENRDVQTFVSEAAEHAAQNAELEDWKSFEALLNLSIAAADTSALVTFLREQNMSPWPPAFHVRRREALFALANHGDLDSIAELLGTPDYEIRFLFGARADLSTPLSLGELHFTDDDIVRIYRLTSAGTIYAGFLHAERDDDAARFAELWLALENSSVQARETLVQGAFWAERIAPHHLDMAREIDITRSDGGTDWQDAVKTHLDRRESQQGD